MSEGSGTTPAELPTSALLRQTQAALAASQQDLTRVERERDEAKLALAAALDDRDWRDRVRADAAVQTVADSNDLIRAELASARQEIDQLRARPPIRLNGPMVDRLRKCAADTSPNWDGRITVYPPEARELIQLIDLAIPPKEG